MSAAAVHRAVVVGAGAVGRLFAEQLHRSGVDVCVVDPSPDQPEVPRTRHLRDDVIRPGPELAAELAGTDLVLLAVPEPVAVAALSGVARLVRPGTLLVDTASVKSRVVAGAATLPQGLDVVSLNPLFAPSLGIDGRPVAAVVVRDGPRAREVLRMIAAWGGVVVPVTAEEHDRLAAATQALTHATVLAFGLALAELGFDVGRLTRAATPPHAALTAVLARVVSGTPDVYWEVQAANPWAGRARAALAGAVGQLSRSVDDGDRAAFDRVLSDVRGLLGRDLERWRERCTQAFDNPTWRTA